MTNDDRLFHCFMYMTVSFILLIALKPADGKFFIGFEIACVLWIILGWLLAAYNGIKFLLKQ